MSFRGFVTAFVALSTLGAPTTALAFISFQSGNVYLLRRSSAETAQFVSNTAQQSGVRYFLVQFESPITPQQREALHNSGLNLLDYVGKNGYFAVVSAQGLQVNGLAAIQSLTRAAELQRAWKLHPFLLGGHVPDWTMSGAIASPRGHRQINELKSEPDPFVGLYVKFHPDISLNDEALAACARHGATVRAQIRSVNALVVETRVSSIFPFVDEEEVQWIEPALPKWGDLNAENRIRVGANVAQSAPYGLDGAGVSVLLYDSGLARWTHGDFGSRLTPYDASSLTDHSTHVAGTIGGNGAASGGNNRGMAPAVTLLSYGFQTAGSGTILYTNPGDLESDYDNAINVHGAVLANNSIGSNIESNGLPCEFQGDYGLTSSLVDAISAGSLGRRLPIVWAAGNERQTSRCDVEGFGDYFSVSPPSGAKNPIVVGAVNANDDSMTGFSSWGPLDDGRLKPDVVAPGCQSGGDNGVTSCSVVSDTAYTVKCGTSMAAPTVTGLAALWLQDFRTHFPFNPDPPGATVKAHFIHSAVDLGLPGPDYQFGFGSVQIIPAIEFMRAASWVESDVSQDETYAAFLDVVPGTPQLKATLVWDDVPGTPNVVTGLVNDLDLRVIPPGGGSAFPWTLDPAAPSGPAIRTQSDHRNNVEQVVIDSPPPGVYRVEVSGFVVPQGPQKFSLIATPSPNQCSATGAVLLDRSQYACDDAVAAKVIDCDLNTNSESFENAFVTVASDSEPEGEIVALHENGADSSTFTGFAAIGSEDSPGVVLVAPGDSVWAAYTDADDGHGGVNVVAVDTAAVDCDPPAIISVQIDAFRPHDATIVIETTEPSLASVQYGTSCANLGMTVSSAVRGTNHMVHLEGLNAACDYFASVIVTDNAGNLTLDDMGGSCYQFATTPVPDFFTEIFDADDEDLDGHSITFTPAAGFDSYTACTSVITSLPTDPSGGTNLNLPDDGPPVQVTLTGGASVALYGETYGSFFVSPNGYITFGYPDTLFLETLIKHFSNRRISVLFDDFDPTLAGTGLFQQLPDRAVVTWLGVSEWFGFNSNTFQAELFFNGDIRLSWLGIDALDGLAGLSKGTGLSQDFVETDLSAQISCDAEPPQAFDQVVTTSVNTSVDIMLLASDANMELLTFRITSLPAHGTLEDPMAGRIDSAPYDLVAGGGIVRFTPNSGFSGKDTIAFEVDDGALHSNTGFVKILVGDRELVRAWSLNSQPAWVSEGLWAWGVPQGIGGDPTSGATGSNVCGFNLAGAYPANMVAPQYMATGPIDCSQFSGAQLRFKRWLGVDDVQFDHATIETSPNGTNWFPAWQNASGTINDTTWVPVELAIDSVFDGQPAARVRWGMGPTDSSVNLQGWNIDDVEIWAIPAGPCNSVIPGDVNSDGEVDGLDLQAFVDLLTQGGGAIQATCAADLEVSGTVDEADIPAMVDQLVK